MSKTPPEDLVVIARKIDPEFHAKITGPWDNSQPWRLLIPTSLIKIWGRLDYSERLVAFIFAHSYHPTLE